MQSNQRIDAIDQRILRVLESEGRISNAALSERVSLSASACLRRVQELERTGRIKRCRAVLATFDQRLAKRARGLARTPRVELLV